MVRPTLGPENQANFKRQLEKQNIPHFWHLLHLRNPKKFVFGTKLQLVSHMHSEMGIFEKVSEEIHERVVKERDEFLKRLDPVFQPDVTFSNIHESLIEIFNLRSMDRSFFKWFHYKFLLKIVESTAIIGENLWSKPKYRRIFMMTFWRFLDENDVRLRIKQAELVAKGMFDTVQMLVVQIWHLQTHLFLSEHIPVPREFFTSDIAVTECFFTATDMLRMLRRCPEKMNLFTFMHLSTEQDHQMTKHYDLVIESEFLKILPASFISKFKIWMEHLNLAMKRFVDNLKIEGNLWFRKLHRCTTQHLNYWEMSVVLGELLDELLNDSNSNSNFQLFNEEWREYILEMIVEMETATLELSRAEEEQDEHKMMRFLRVVVLGNRSLCSELAELLPSGNIGERRVLLAQLFRFCCRFTGSLMRFLFSSQWSFEGNTVEAMCYSTNGHDDPRNYDMGKWVEILEENIDPTRFNFDFDAYLDENPRVEEQTSQPPNDRQPEPIVRIPPPSLSRQSISEHRNPMHFRRNLHPEPVRHSSTIRTRWDDRRIQKPSTSNSSEKPREHCWTREERKDHHHHNGSPRASMDSKDPNIHRRNDRNRETSRVGQEVSERQQRIHRRHHTPAPPRISTPVVKTPPTFNQQPEPSIDNNSNEENREEPISEIHPWILYNYPIPPTIRNNETSEYGSF